MGADVAAHFREKTAGADVAGVVDKAEPAAGVDHFGGAADGVGVGGCRVDFVGVGSCGGGGAPGPAYFPFLLHDVAAVVLGFGDFDDEGHLFGEQVEFVKDGFHFLGAAAFELRAAAGGDEKKDFPEDNTEGADQRGKGIDLMLIALMKHGVDLEGNVEFLGPAGALEGQVIRSRDLTEGVVIGRLGRIDAEGHLIDPAGFEGLHACFVQARGAGGNGADAQTDAFAVADEIFEVVALQGIATREYHDGRSHVFDFIQQFSPFGQI